MVVTTPVADLLHVIADRVPPAASQDGLSAAVNAAPTVEWENIRNLIERISTLTADDVETVRRGLVGTVEPLLPQIIQDDLAALHANPSVENLAKLVKDALDIVAAP